MKELIKAEDQIMQNLWKLEKGFVNDIIDAGRPCFQSLYLPPISILSKTYLKYSFGFIFFINVLISNAQQNAIAKKNLVTISGICADTTIKTAKITVPRSFPWTEVRQPIIVESLKRPNNTFSFQVDGSKAHMMYVQVLFGTWPIFVTSGDSVHFTI